MKNLLTVFIIALVFPIAGRAQVTYQHYYNPSVEWRIYDAGWTGIYNYVSYKTSYFDGDTLINSNWYYKEYSIHVDSNFTTPLTVDTIVNGPFFIREDATFKIWDFNPSLNADQLSMDWASIGTLAVGDTFPYEQCHIGYADSLYIGTTPLLRQRPTDTTSIFGSFPMRGYVEGIGEIFLPSGLGIEENSWINCFHKDNVDLVFGPYDCAAFPAARHSAPTHIPTLALVTDVDIYPMPANHAANVQIAGADHDTWLMELRDATGKLVMASSSMCSGKNSLPLNYAPGLYFARFTNERTSEVVIKKLVVARD